MRCPICGEFHEPNEVIFHEKEPGRISFMINLVKVWSFFSKRRKKDVAVSLNRCSDRSSEDGNSSNIEGTSQNDG